MVLSFGIFGNLTIIQILFGPLSIVSMIIGTILVILNRNEFPLNKRSFIFVFVYSLICTIIPFFHTLRASGVLPCAIYWIASVLLPFHNFLVLLLVNTRVFHYRYIYQEKRIGSSSNSKFWNSVGTPKFNLILWIVCTILHIIFVVPFSINYFSWNDKIVSCIGISIDFTTGGTGISLIILYLIVFGLFKAKLQKKEDILKVKREVIVLVVFWIPTLICWVFLNAFTSIFGLVEISLAFPVSWWLTIGWTLINVFQLKKSKYDLLQEEEGKKNSQIDEEALTLENVLSDSLFKSEFEDFLESEWSLEALNFIDTAHEFKEHFEELSPVDRLKKAKEIYNEFIIGKSQININFDVGSAIQQNIVEADTNPELLKITIFDNAREESFLLLKTGSFLRFKNYRRKKLQAIK